MRSRGLRTVYIVYDNFFFRSRRFSECAHSLVDTWVCSVIKFEVFLSWLFFMDS